MSQIGKPLDRLFHPHLYVDAHKRFNKPFISVCSCCFINLCVIRIVDGRLKGLVANLDQ